MPPIINTLDVPFCIYVAVIYYCILALVQEELTLFFCWWIVASTVPKILLECLFKITMNYFLEQVFSSGKPDTCYWLSGCFWICLLNCLFFGLWVWVPNVSTLQGLFVHKNCKLWNTFGRDISIKKCHL